MKFYSASKPLTLITMLLNLAHAPVCFDTLFPGSDCSLPPLLLKALEGDGKKTQTHTHQNKKKSGRKERKRQKHFPGGKTVRTDDSVLVAWLFNKSILICYIINNNLIKNPKYSIVSFLC